MVFVGEILIDDTLSRSVALDEGDQPTGLTVRATAQDHVSTATYRIQIKRAEPALTLNVTATATSRCVAGKVVLVVQAKSEFSVPISLSVSTGFGTKQIAAVAQVKVRRARSRYATPL